jgi:hypothetical protein
MITNRPEYLLKNIKYYKGFPFRKSIDIDYKRLPPLLNLDLHTLNGILPLTRSRFDYIGKNGIANGEESTIIEVNPLPIEYEYYQSLGITEFQAVQLVFNCFVFEDEPDGSLKGLPYSLSLHPMTKNNQVDTWNIELMKKFDLRKLCQEGGYIYSDYNPFKGWYDGIVSHYSVFQELKYGGFLDCIGLMWGMYFLAPTYDKKEVIMMENKEFSAQINSKYRKFKSNLYFNSFSNANPRRIWGCDSPIELFLLQAMYFNDLHPEIQMCIYRDGTITPNYYRMQESELWIGQEKLITAADFYFTTEKLAIFCDGAEYHDKEKDEAINENLQKFGVKVLRFSGKQITEEIESVIDIILKNLER